MDWTIFALMLTSLLAVSAAALGAYALHHSLHSRIEVEAMKRSTHQIQFVPAEPADEAEERALNDDLARQERKAFMSVGDLEDDELPYN
jgi:hypothetical protein